MTDNDCDLNHRLKIKCGGQGYSGETANFNDLEIGGQYLDSAVEHHYPRLKPTPPSVTINGAAKVI